MELEELFTQVRTHAVEKLPPATRSFNDPANWLRKRGIALVQADTDSLLGIYTEYVHRSEPGARRLVREDNPPPVSATERIDSSWWWPETIPAAEPSQTRREVILPLELVGGWTCPLVEVAAVLVQGGIVRVELLTTTVFAKGDEILELAAGTNVLPAMTREAKIALFEEIS
jgi:hypothetical protein